jgi:hypothetical protein
LAAFLAAAVAAIILLAKGASGTPVLILTVAAFITGVAAVVLRFVERPKAIVVRRLRREPRVIH